MASTKQHVSEATKQLSAIGSHLNRISSLDGARNPKAMYPAVRDAICAATELAHDLTPLRCRLALQLNKKANSRDSKAAAKKAEKAVK